jgi:hypothetical protein
LNQWYAPSHVRADLSFLVGRELIQVGIGLYQIQFHFDEDVTVSVETEFRYFDGQDEWSWRQEPGSHQIAARTVVMLAANITSLDSNENGTLVLTFSNGHRLTILDPYKEYEAYAITRPGQPDIIV